MFDHSNTIFKPLWTYFFESKNIKNIVYFYSTNNVPIVYNEDKAKKINNFIAHGWELMNWNNYLVWDEHQLSFFSDYFNINKNYFKITGPIPFGGSLYLPKNKKKIISVFDVTPFQMTSYKKLGLPEIYYDFENIKKFYENLCQFSSNDYTFIFKIKRITKNTDPNYIEYLESLKKKDFNIVENICSFSLIKSSSKVISLPFSSPSIIAKHYNVGSIFFDPTNKLKFLNDYKFINHDIQIFYRNEIEEWLFKR